LNLDDAPRFRRRFDPGHSGRELSHSRRQKKGHDIDFDAKGARDFDHEPHGHQGMPAEVEEIRRGADFPNLKDIPPDRHHLCFGFGRL
jgi:hypothetical protein